MQLAPAVHIPKRSRFGELDIDRALAGAARACVGVDVPMPVVVGRRSVGMVLGRTDSDVVDVLPARAGEPLQCGFDSYDDLIAKITLGQKYTVNFARSPSTAVTANYADLWPCGGGDPGLYSGTAYTARQFDESTVGALYHGGNKSPATKHLISAWATFTATTSTVILYDRVLCYEACAFNANVLQSFSNPVAAARYVGSGDAGLRLMVTAQSTLGATQSVFNQLNYVGMDDQAYACPTAAALNVRTTVAGPNATTVAVIAAPMFSAASTISRGFYMPLASGSNGVKSLVSYATSAANTGTLCFALVRPLAVIPIASSTVVTLVDAVQQIGSLERIIDGACLSWLLFSSSTNAAVVQGGFDVAWS